MAISRKRAHATLGIESSGTAAGADIEDPFKRRTLILTNSASSRRLNTPRDCAANISAQIQNEEAYGSNSDSDSDSDFCSNGHALASGMLNPKLVETVARYSDSDTDKDGDDPAFFIRFNQNQDVEKGIEQKRMSRPGSFSSSSTRRSQVSKLDLSARERCFDYIVQSIDEVWARYCDTTSSAEAKVYGNLSTQRAALKQQHQPKLATCGLRKPLNISDKDTESESECEFEGSLPNIEDYDEDNSGYKSEATNPTEYETDYGESRTVSNLPDSVKLQSLKFRLTNAKNDLEQVYDSKEEQDSDSFWRRWDMIKYSAVEMMEEDDDDEIIENVIEELEQGRCYAN